MPCAIKHSGCDRTHLPCREDAAGLGEVQSRNVLVRIKANDEGGDTERPDSTRLRVLLLDARDVSRNVFDRYGVLDSEPMRLALYPGLVDEDTCVCSQTCAGETVGERASALSVSVLRGAALRSERRRAVTHRRKQRRRAHRAWQSCGLFAGPAAEGGTSSRRPAPPRPCP